jgi:hypothetical protein
MDASLRHKAAVVASPSYSSITILILSSEF